MFVKSGSSGFSLMEVMVAMAILSIGLVSVAGVYSQAASSLSQVEGYERAGMEARMRLAAFLNAGDIKPGETSGNCETLPGGRWKIVSRNEDDYPGVSRVEITVLFFTEGREHEYILETAEVDRNLPARSKTQTKDAKK
ncbi:prepilin-type N-terminal cleavage/methylation domain-containing protein [Desulfovibrio sp. JC010]|uniref:type IV pilus modification PilV family protein n=1 Tax=Desulfovibrio sp. JC010 TaxID=2593641 RepID=UPI0013D85AAE|nr:prepilin-type N-terminal cleavage/methylation domain-containing protein [Desulfovibrio sp. JC010]NDV27654.1 prepilin-type N-terminal cleavage/methylation domain-containing protein [Desulfovibrio sp. JC010]